MNELIGRSNNTGAMAAKTESAAIANIQAKMILARNFPRNIEQIQNMIDAECKNKSLAEVAVYEFQRGNSVVRGASIRLVECVARYWGNMLSGVEELNSGANFATVRAFAWDLETNFSDEKVFDVEYKRNTKNGTKILTDERDKYELIANMGARRKRACMQAVIPKFIIDRAVDMCNQTLENEMKKVPIDERKEKMKDAFAEIADWITPELLAGVCGKDFDNLSIKDIVRLGNLYNAIKDGFVKPEEAFGKETKDQVVSNDENDMLNDLNADLSEGKIDGTYKR